MGTKPIIAGTMEVTDIGLGFKLGFVSAIFIFSFPVLAPRFTKSQPSSRLSHFFDILRLFTKAVNPPYLCVMCIDYRIWLYLAKRLEA